jgi:predicted DNA-binding transcriptional regulator AlpA
LLFLKFRISIRPVDHLAGTAADGSTTGNDPRHLSAHTPEQGGMHPQAGSSREKNLNEEPDRLWGVREVAEFLGVPVTTLYQWRYQRYGPTGARVGRYLRYDPREVRAWFRSLDDGAA